MDWIYIIRCEYDNYYVGKTKRLYRRMWEHMNGTGSIFTTEFEPEEVVAIYKTDEIDDFLKFKNIRMIMMILKLKIS